MFHSYKASISAKEIFFLFKNVGGAFSLPVILLTRQWLQRRWSERGF